MSKVLSVKSGRPPVGLGSRMRRWHRLTGAVDVAGAYLRILLAIASFLIYGSAVLALGQYRTAALVAERFPIASAVSTIVYGAPLGTAYSDVSARILDPNTTLDTALKQTAEGDMAPGALLSNGGAEGSGMGYYLIANCALFLFGFHAVSPILAVLALMGISGAAFLWRFGSSYAVVVLLYFVGLTLLLFTPLVWTPTVATEVPVGGIRYFCVVGVLPAFHLACELLDGGASGRTIGWWRLCLLGAQAVILVLAILTRTSNATLLGVVGLIGLCSLWRHRRDRSQRWRQLGNGAVIAGVAVGFFALIVLLLPPNYLKDGRFTGATWHRAFVGLGENPEWPFGNLREVYDCDYADYLPGLKLNPGALDSNGGCVWQHYIHTHNYTPTQNSPVFDWGVYEPVVRDAFFYVVRNYPRQVLETYLFYKTRILYGEITVAMHPQFDLTRYSRPLRGLFVAALIILLAFLLTPPAMASPNRSPQIVWVTLILGLSAFPGYYVAWPGTAQTADLKLYTLVFAGAVLYALVEWVPRTIAARWQRA